VISSDVTRVFPEKITKPPQKKKMTANYYP